MPPKSSGDTPTPSWNADEVLQDYRIGYLSRQASLLGRKEVLTGKAKFGIFGDGKEVPQIAMAKAFRKGDWRSGYYRDQTFMFALGAINVKQYFAQLYADADREREPATVGRQMNNHFSTRYIDDDGKWLDQVELYNSASDASPTACQMARLVGLGYASKLYRNVPELKNDKKFSRDGNEIAFGTIGDASTSEGVFWESMNAAGVLQIPLLMSVWDDGFGISVPKEFQTTKGSISSALKGFAKEGDQPSGFRIFNVKAWDYAEVCQTYLEAAKQTRADHTPTLIHVEECSQPQGHSTSGSHERYKSADRLRWEDENDCLMKMRSWIITSNFASEDQLAKVEEEIVGEVKRDQQKAWDEYITPLEAERIQLLEIFESESHSDEITEIIEPVARALKKVPTIHRREIHAAARRCILKLSQLGHRPQELLAFEKQYREKNQHLYSDFQFALPDSSPLRVESVPADIEGATKVDGFQIINDCFEMNLKKHPNLFIIGEDVGKLGGVNQGFKDLSSQFGDDRVTDTGIREATILGQGLGAAMRGLRPVVDIQYLDYLLYCFQVLSDDLASLHYRSAGGQLAPVIIRTKGHRLEGIWHTGSPIGMILNGVRGVHVCVPRNMTQAAGMYNTLLEGDDPALVIEVLNGYRVKENQPKNLSDLRVALGEVEVLREGDDITVVTYGACIRIAEDAAKFLQTLGITVEIIDAQTLLPFDREHGILESIKKTNAVVFFDEDVPGGATAYLMQQVLEEQNAHEWLDAKPRTLSAQPHRSAYASDGDYYSKPNAEDLIELIGNMMYERDPHQFSFFG